MRKNNTFRKIAVDPMVVLKNFAFYLLSGRDYSEREMRKKLTLKMKRISVKSDPKLVENLISRLKELEYLNDEKYGKRYVASKLSVSPQGKYALRSKLFKKGIPRNVFSKLWEEGNFDEEQLAKNLLEQKSKIIFRLPPEKRKRKVLQLLASRGFSADIVYGLLEKFSLK